MINNFTNTDLLILSDFSGSSIRDPKFLAQDLICKLKLEPLVTADNETHDYNLHFNFGIQNNSKQLKTINIIIDLEEQHLNLKPKTIYTSPSPTHQYCESKTNVLPNELGYQFEIKIDPESCLYISNTLWNPIDAINKTFESLCQQEPLHVIDYGTSCNGNKLSAYKTFQDRDLNKPLILITSGFHPTEGDTTATEAIAKWLLTTGKDNTKNVDFVIIPVVNPDGFTSGYNGCNTSGINLFWDFQNYNLKSCPEAYYLWEFIKQFPPNIYLDFHAYSIQGKQKKIGPYFKPEIFYFGKLTKEYASKMLKSLESLPGNKSQKLYAPSTLAYKITKTFNTITFAKYHLHQDLGIHGLQQLAINVVQNIVHTLNHCDLHDQILRPYGSRHKPYKDILSQMLYTCRYSLPKQLKKQFK